jgi:hypothetical protein
MAAETGMLHGHIVTQNVKLVVRKGMEFVNLAESNWHV